MCIAVTVFKEPTLSSSMLVRPDGMISMPLLGDVKASGKTPLQLADEITAKLKKYIQDPNVTVVLSQMNSKKVYLMGEIGKTGPIEMTPGMTLLQAIATAGGLTPLRQLEEDLHSARRRRKAAEDSRAIQASVEGRRFAQSHSESGRYDCRSVRLPNETESRIMAIFFHRQCRK